MSVPTVLPNCTLKQEKVDWSISTPGWEWVYLFCANCGADGGRVLKTYLPREFAFYQCNACAEKYPVIPGTYREPDEAFREKVANAMLERYGHPLTEFEILAELQDPSSVISKLEKEGQGR
jgi:hypothetical protein